MKPLLNVARTEDELRQKEEELNKLREKVQRDEASRKEIEEQQTQLMEEKNQLFVQLQRVSMYWIGYGIMGMQPQQTACTQPSYALSKFTIYHA